ncbi:crossover junction endonuclease EME1 [Pristis pectinata]|uniref:crossover junction endonuclease EME1 n=1 Tax=Pristis pectinata TaxID=685728 RepID=UPI00223DE5E1|nr:crossover junction endonuclease EME1 [Pristis pectinata]XP_051889056.1 crossover junction endonuclease EME1 [Pristis pectinata]XP_051889057.1 crossover junction endonuclease EME1 [Pristis pectinata]XP_051889059.1 crossover junction endonuclease EME1 [Pristis pectinata]
MLWCNDDSENKGGDTNLDDDSTKLPAINFTGLRSHAISDGSLDFNLRAPKRATSIDVQGSDSKSCDLPLSGEAESSQLDLSHSPACLSNEIVMVVSSESDGENDLEIPLSERLKMKLAENKKFDKSDRSISESSQENYSHVPNKLQCSQIDPKVKLADVTELKDQTMGPSFIRRRAVSSRSTWDISDSDGDELCILQPVKSCEPHSNLSQSCIKDLASSKEVTTAPSNHKKRIKRNPSEMGRAQQEALKKCQERELQRAEKENIRRLREQEKATRKMLAGIEKMLRPGECLKHIQVSIDPGLLQVEGGGQLLSTLQAMEVSCVIENQTISHSVTWRRRQACIVGQQMNEVADWADELHVVIHIPLVEFVSMVHAQKQELEGAATEGQVTLESFTLNILQKSAGRVPSLVIVKLEKHFSLQKKQKSQKKHQQTAARNGQDKSRRKSREHNVSLISRVDVELVLVHLQVSVGVQVQLLETWKEFADYVGMFTKAVAEAPFKRARDNNGLSVYLENDGSRGVKIDRSGKGLLSIWKKQIQQLNRVSSEIANAIVSVYPSPRSLTQAYQECSSEQEKEKLLADIPVRRGEGITSTTRRIGPELSKRVYLLMTSLEAESFLE